MSLLRRSLALMLLSALVLNVSGTQAPEGVRLEGIVVDGATARPLSLVSVQISGLKITTDPEGRFAFESVPPGRHTLVAEKTGYLRSRPEGRTRGNPGIVITLARGQPAESLAIRMFRAGTVTGQVYDSSGNGIPYMLAVPYRATYDEDGNSTLVRVLSSGPISPREIQGTRSLNVASSLSDGVNRTGQGDDRGAFRIANLEPGRYAFYLIPMVNTPPDPVFYPGTLGSSRAEIVEVESGKEVVLKPITLTNGPEGKLRVQVINQTGESRASAFVQVRRRGERETLLQAILNARTEPGECPNDPLTCPVMGSLAPGSYDVEAVLNVRNKSFVASRRVNLEMTERDLRLDLAVSGGATVSGKAMLVRTDGSVVPVVGLTVGLRSNETLANVVFPTTSDTGGVFNWASLPEGVFRVRTVSGVPAGSCLNEVRQDTRDVLRDGLSVTNRGATLNATLIESGIALAGVATTPDGKKVSGAIVALVPDDRTRSDAFVSAVADQNGAFEMSCLRPGAYHLLAWTELEGAAYRNAEFMKKYDGQGQRVNVQAPGRLAANAVVLP